MDLNENSEKTIKENITRVEASHNQERLEKLRAADKKTRQEEREMEALASQESYLAAQKTELKNLGSTATMLKERIDLKNKRLAAMNKPEVMPLATQQPHPPVYRKQSEDLQLKLHPFSQKPQHPQD